ncbi:MAG: hypothetical protein COB49_02535 [Alphaproteobacteria bacterium]|nr:PilZ domain-containing protein [Hyphomicrobiales bacterium]PCI51223.1 MAG: hypothetical protein COB49_02535 [Alphaproteobacteria bacterium]
MSKVNKEVEVRRRFARQHVLLKAMLDTGDYEFECVAYDLSLTGVRLKLDLPLKTKCDVWLKVKNSPHIPAIVAWSEDGFVGLEFSMPTGQVADVLGNVGSRLPKS